MSSLDDARQARREAADALLKAIEQQVSELDALAGEIRVGRGVRTRLRERIEDLGGHEPDTLFGSWLDSDDRLSVLLEHSSRLQRETAQALRDLIAATELMFFEIDPGADDPRSDPLEGR